MEEWKLSDRAVKRVSELSGGSARRASAILEGAKKEVREYRFFLDNPCWAGIMIAHGTIK